MRGAFVCSHCTKTFRWGVYASHVKDCIAARIASWDEAAYSANYYTQVRAQSRFRQPGDPRRRRSMFQAWRWWAVPHQDGPPL